jgi:signal peptidase I
VGQMDGYRGGGVSSQRRRGRVIRRKEMPLWQELPLLLVVAFCLAVLIRTFLVQAFFIPSGSMQQTLEIGDRVLVNKVPYYFRGPHRGEIVVFNGLDNFDEGVTLSEPSNPVAKVLRAISSTIGLGAPSENDYIKRVIGVGGDRVMCCDDAGRVVVTPHGGRATALDEPYVFENDTTDMKFFCAAGTGRQLCPPGAEGIFVPDGRLWVMGDHRGNSSDSRFHLADSHQGTVPEDKVVGRAFAVVFPLGRNGFLRVPETFESVALPGVPLGLGLAAALPLALLRRRLRTR